MQLRGPLATYRFDARRMKTLNIPTLLFVGGETTNPDIKLGISLLHASVPRSNVVVLEGQQHNAMDSARELLAEKTTIFLLDRR